MAAYRSTCEWYEDGYGNVRAVLVVADTIAGTADPDAATEVSVFEWDEVGSDFDVDVGKATIDEFQFVIKETAAETEDDWDAVEFALGFLTDQTRYVALLIEWNDPVEDGDFAFRGAVAPALSAKAERWTDGEDYSEDAMPVREWQLTAIPLGIAELLTTTLTDAIDAIDETWQNANVIDRPFWRDTGVYTSEWDGDSWNGVSATRELRYADLASFGALLQELLDKASATSDLAFEWVDTNLDLWAAKLYWRYIIRGGTMRHRYGTGYGRIYDTNEQLTTNGLQVSWALLSTGHGDETESMSWRRYETVVELLYALASTFGTFLQFVPTTEGYQVKFGARSTLVTNDCYIRDVTSDDLDVSTVEGEEETFHSGQTPMMTDGYGSSYNYDGGYYADKSDRRERDGECLPINLAGGVLRLINAGAREGAYEYNECQIPHNVRFYKGGSPEEGGGIYNTAGFTAGLYYASAADEGSFADNLPDLADEYPIITRPVGVLIADLPLYSERVFYSMSRFLQVVRAIDRDAYRTERTLSVPFVMGFRAAPDGDSDWRNIQLGYKITIDGAEWVVVGIRRKRSVETEIRLQQIGRFQWQEPENIADLPDVSGAVSTESAVDPRLVRTGIAGEGIAEGHVVAVDSATGEVMIALAHHDHYGLIVGVALNNAATGEEVRYQTNGRVMLPDGLCEGEGWGPGTRLFVRNVTGIVPSGYNLSSSPLTASSAVDDEDLLQYVGTVVDTDTLVIDIGHPIIIDPEV